MDINEIKERMNEGRIYDPGNPELLKEQLSKLEPMYDYNATRPTELQKRIDLLPEMFAEIGEGSYIEPPIHANWGCSNVHVGKQFYANSNLTLVDDGEIFIGDNCMFAPNVIIATGGHPVNPELRSRGMQFNLPVRIGSNVWLGAGAIVLPGVSIGDNTVIGAGSVVTKDIPANVVAVGNPCRVLREIGERDREYYYRDRKIDVE